LTTTNMHCTDATTAVVAGLRCPGEECIGMALRCEIPFVSEIC
jgi:hypothetical protein